jgi:hypothetical protein
MRNYENINLPRRLELWIVSSLINHVNEFGLLIPYQIRNSDLAMKMTKTNARKYNENGVLEYPHFTKITIIRNLKKMPRRFIKVSKLFHGDNNGVAYGLDIDSICSCSGNFSAFEKNFKEKCSSDLWKRLENMKNRNSLKWAE